MVCDETMLRSVGEICVEMRKSPGGQIKDHSSLMGGLKVLSCSPTG